MSTTSTTFTVPTEGARSWSVRRSDVLFAGILVFFLAYSWMYRGISVPNERSRVYLAVSLVDCGRLDIDCAVLRYGAINDWAKVGEHHYTDKAPGSSFLAAIPYLGARLFSAPGDWSIEGLVALERRLLMIPLSLLGAFLLRRSLRTLGVSPPSTLATVAVWLLGSAASHYASAFYGHQIAAVALLAAVHWGLVVDWGPRRRRAPPAALSGVACGVAGLVEYQAIPLALVIALGVAHRAYREGSAGQMLRFALGALPCAGLFVAYHAAVFGGPFEVSYAHLVSDAIQAKHTRGIGGVGLPRWSATQGLLLSLHRGLLATSPVFILVPFGLRRLGGRLAVVVGACLVGSVLIAVGADAWVGGWSFGPRLLVPAFGLAMLPLALVLDRVRSLGPAWARGAVWAAIAVGILYTQLAQAVFAELPDDALNPIRDVFAPMLSAGHMSPNVLSKLTGETGLWTLLPIAAATLGLLVWLGAVFRPRAAGAASRRGAAAAWSRWALAATVVFALFAAYVGLRKPGWNDHQRRDWDKVVVRWERGENKR